MLKQDQIDEIIFDACQKMSCEKLYPEIDWDFNNRLTRQVGNANMRTKYLQFSTKLFNIATPQQQEDTVRHEVAHLGHAFVRSETWRKETQHGIEWQHFAILAGAKPSATCSIEGIVIATREVFCDCKTHTITKNRYTRIVKGTGKYACNMCKASIRLVK